MITPLFKCEQTNNFIIVKATLKYVKFSDFDYFIENNNFRFSLKPYHLNLHFSHNLNALSLNNKFTYDIEQQLLTCTIEKSEEGTHFENLELLSTLLENPNKQPKPYMNKIEEINNNNDNTNNNICNIKVNNAEELNDYLFNIYSQPDITQLTLNEGFSDEQYYYGFNNNFNDVFDKRAEDAYEISDLNPKKVPIKFRYYTKLEKEMVDFQPERYVYDMYLDCDDEEMCDDNFKQILSKSNASFINSISPQPNSMNYNEKELQILKDINKTKISFIDSPLFCPFKFYLQLVDILFAFCYDCIFTEYEHNSESGWTINKLSTVLSCHVDYDKNFYSHSKEISFTILEELLFNLVISAYRRVLIYPLYRNWKLCERSQKEVCDILKCRRYGIVKCLLKIRMIFEKSEPRYLLNLLYIDPFLKWVQFYSEEHLFVIIANEIEKIKVKEIDVKLNLENAEKDVMEKEAAEDVEMGE